MRRDGDLVVCGYHGLTFGPDGRCVHNPFAERIPAGAAIPAFTAVERYDAVRIRAGRARRLLESLIARETASA